MLIARLTRDDAGDRGAVAVIVVIFFASLVMFAVGALAVDSGQFYAEKAQLQNGADAGALAAAKRCANSGCDLAALTPIAQGYADKNANDNASNVEEICGSDGLPACEGNLCPSPSGATHWVDVQLSTEQSNGDKALPAFFGKAVLGDKYNGNIHACAQAQWGPAGGGTGLAMTMSVCDWLADTSSTFIGDPAARYADPEPPYPANAWPPAYGATVTKKIPAVPRPGGENVVQLTGANKCGAGQSGANVPGGFAWLSDQANGQTPTGCQMRTDENGYVYSSSGGINGKNGICGTKLGEIYDASVGPKIPNNLNPIFIPVFDLSCDSSHKLVPDGTPCPVAMPPSSYHIAGYAEFVLTGYDYNPLHEPSLINAGAPCSGGSFTCLYGLFTSSLVTDPNVEFCETCPPLGATAAKLTG